jgi:hypothetical protein
MFLYIVYSQAGPGARGCTYELKMVMMMRKEGKTRKPHARRIGVFFPHHRLILTIR